MGIARFSLDMGQWSRLSDSSIFNSSDSSQERLSLQVTSNNSADITGDYVGTVRTDYGLHRDFRDMCSGYYNYFYYVLFAFPVTVSYWSIKVNSKSSLWM